MFIGQARQGTSHNKHDKAQVTTSMTSRLNTERNTTDMNEKMITVAELQEILRISRQTVMRWRKEGMPHYKYNASVRFELEEVKKWLKERSEENEQ